MTNRKDARTVYSTEQGFIGNQSLRREARMAGKKRRKSKGAASASPFPSDGRIRVRRETSGRGGKTVTTVHGLSGTPVDIKTMAKRLKQACGTGGAVKNGVVEIQGDQVERLLEVLAEEGIQAVKAGG